MSGRLFKKLRKEMRKDFDRKAKDFRAQMKLLPFWQRLCVCVRIIIKP